MSDTPEGNICKVSANLGWASDTLAMVDKTMLKLSAEVKTILRERDNLQDQRDFAMSEIERLRKERDEAREVAENLVEYAHECLVRLESWGKGYDRYEREMETIREAIAGCQKWKEAAK